MIDKTNEMKRELKSLFPEIEENKYYSMLCHLCTRHKNNRQYYSRSNGKVGRLKQLTKNEIILLDYLIKNEINPITAYKWFRVSRLPEDIKDKLRRGEISVYNARKTFVNRVKMRESREGFEMCEEILNVVRNL